MSEIIRTNAPAAAFVAARDFLGRAHGTDCAHAVTGFTWPRVSRFNRALGQRKGGRTNSSRRISDFS